MVLAATTAAAQSQLTEHTRRLDDSGGRPQATLADVAWMVGSWTGEAFGGRFEEVWNPPSAGSMVGMFKLIDDDAVEFYELMLIVEEEDSLSLKVKHFTPEFSAWEDKDDYITFRLVALKDDEVHFSGLSFYRRNDNSIDAYIAMEDEANAVREEKLLFRRATDER